MSFVVATGVECSAPIIRGGSRRDQLLLTEHWTRVEQDLDLVAAMGITHLRYGVPFHVVAADAERLDWAWTDAAMTALRGRPIEPIVDLLHFAVPDDLSGIGDPRLPERYGSYVRAFVERYPWVRWYTPVNEPYITALFSAKNGWWNERQRTNRAFVQALRNMARCAVEGTRIIREHRPDAVFLQSDACEVFRPAEPAAAAWANHLTERGRLGFDLTYGHPVSVAMRRWLVRYGMEDVELDWFLDHGSSENAIVGLDYYPLNERLVTTHGRQLPGHRQGFDLVARTFHERYAVPVMLAETNHRTDLAVAWLTDVWNETVALADSGVPVAGFCWYSLTDQIDWDTCLREPNGTVNSLGLVDLGRVRRPVATLYEALARQVSSTGRAAAIALEATA
ncbi:MAG TPA: family 1 glycosylhydrolase [Patescibacteria group bacterium]|nr:family 1 glycosylhydrolase [Patescibacteria group bacterium]